MYILYLDSLLDLASLLKPSGTGVIKEQDASPVTCSFHQLHAHYFTTVLHIQSVYHRD
jgi:hypothetical protein